MLKVFTSYSVVYTTSFNLSNFLWSGTIIKLTINDRIKPRYIGDAISLSSYKVIIIIPVTYFNIFPLMFELKPDSGLESLHLLMFVFIALNSRLKNGNNLLLVMQRLNIELFSFILPQNLC